MIFLIYLMGTGVVGIYISWNTGEGMNRRREFLKTSIGFLAGIGLFLSPLFSAIQSAYAKAKKTILPKGTKRESLKYKNPRSLDTRNLEATPLEDFEAMGVSDYEVNLNEWRLEVTGHLTNPLRLTYSEILALPSIEKKVLLICPGFFANHGEWKGISMKTLLERAGVGDDVTRVTFSGPKGVHGKQESFPIKDILSDKVFLAYGVNGKPLPRKHGFPLRVVADGYYGDDWVKYVYKMTLRKA
jgi:DMSO/TMAO reductase YedYZ molybdopterin-dependent catalytic subunit